MYRKNLKSISQVYEEVATLFKSHNDLLEEFTYFLPDFSSPTASKKGLTNKSLRNKSGDSSVHPIGNIKRRGKGGKYDTSTDMPNDQREEERKAAASLAKELTFFDKVKARLRNRETYNELIKCLNIFNSEVISKMELQSLVWDILGRYPDLHSGFCDFLARCEGMDFELGDCGKGKDGKLSAKDMQKLKAISAREKFLSRPISELDLSACDRCGPSYRCLPKSFPKAPASARTPLCHEHLNDNWVSVTSGSEDYSFKAMRKNQYEESLFRCEDDRFELDMVLETTRATIDALAPIIEKLNSMPNEAASRFRTPEGALSPIHLRAIERLYGIGTDQGHDIRRMILDYPAATAHVVMARLKQKDSEWKMMKSEITPVWVEVYDKNYNKSLDHRSFYFKQTDKKALSAKGMIGEIKEVGEKKRSNEQSLSVGKHEGGNPSPDLTFTYNDRKVHDDIYAVLKFSSREMMASEHAERVMKLWRDFVEPFFGINRKNPEGDYFDDAAEQAALLAHKDDDEDIVSYESDGLEDAENGKPYEPANEFTDGEIQKIDEVIVEVATETDCTRDDSAGNVCKIGQKSSKQNAAKSEVAKVALEKDEDEDEVKFSDDDIEEYIHAGCKPLSGLHVSVSPMDTGARTSHPKSRQMEERCFYGHDGFYILFRLHQHLYERLATARASAMSMSQQFGQKSISESERAEQERKIHGDFLQLLFQLLNGTVESSSFEDECRTLLGANSYVLFTLDKLIYKMVKQIQSFHADETASKLLHLHEYELARFTASSEETYHANASVLLLDDACYRFASLDMGQRLTLQHMESCLDKVDLPTGSMASQFHEYLESFLQITNVEDGDTELITRTWPEGSGRPAVLLRRAMRIAAPSHADKFVNDVPGNCISVFNSLECKISCSNSKVSYVLDTEDVFHRKSSIYYSRGIHRKLQRKQLVQLRSKKASDSFNRYLEEKLDIKDSKALNQTLLAFCGAEEALHFHNNSNVINTAAIEAPAADQNGPDCHVVESLTDSEVPKERNQNVERPFAIDPSAKETNVETLDNADFADLSLVPSVDDTDSLRSKDRGQAAHVTQPAFSAE